MEKRLLNYYYYAYGDPRRASVKNINHWFSMGEWQLCYITHSWKQANGPTLLDIINLKHRIWPSSYRSILYRSMAAWERAQNGSKCRGAKCYLPVPTSSMILSEAATFPFSESCRRRDCIKIKISQNSVDWSIKSSQIIADEMLFLLPGISNTQISPLQGNRRGRLFLLGKSDISL